MPTNKEIAEWLRDSGRSLYAAQQLTTEYAATTELNKAARLAFDRAAQVEAMGERDSINRLMGYKQAVEEYSARRCRTCEFWERRVAITTNSFHSGYCYNEDEGDDPAWHSNCECGPDFGCIHYAPAPPEGEGE